MVELLEDGETVEWIVDQVLSAGTEEDVQALSAVLAEIAVQVAPAAEAGEEAVRVAAETEELDWKQLEGMQLPPGIGMEQFKQLLASPQGAALADFGAFCQEQGVTAETAGQEGLDEVLQELHEEWLQTPREALEGRRPAEVLEGGRLFPGKVETFRREVPKVGRNDPCPCGSGKKYKKCCGKGG